MRLKKKEFTNKKDAVLDYLKTHKNGITQKIAAEKLNVPRLSFSIKQLQKEGFKINEHIRKPRTGNSYIIYSMT